MATAKPVYPRIWKLGPARPATRIVGRGRASGWWFNRAVSVMALLLSLGGSRCDDHPSEIGVLASQIRKLRAWRRNSASASSSAATADSTGSATGRPRSANPDSNNDARSTGCRRVSRRTMSTSRSRQACRRGEVTRRRATAWRPWRCRQSSAPARARPVPAPRSPEPERPTLRRAVRPWWMLRHRPDAAWLRRTSRRIWPAAAGAESSTISRTSGSAVGPGSRCTASVADRCAAGLCGSAPGRDGPRAAGRPVA